MKKKIALLLTVFLVVSVLSGCSQKQNEPSQAQSSSPEKIVIKLGHIAAEDYSCHVAAVEFKKYVEEQSKGRVEVQLFPNAQLGGDREMTEAVALGTLQMALPATSVLTTYSPKFGILDMPFIFKDRKAAFNAVDGELGAKLNELVLPVGIRILGYNDNGVRHMSNNVRPINEPKDLKGIKMRVMESPIFIDMFKCLGTNPTPMSFGELYTALQQGTVDGQENGASLVYSSKFYEVQKYYSLTGHVISLVAIIINDKFYQSLPDDIRKIIDEGNKKFNVDYQRELEAKAEVESLEKLKQAGMQVNDISPENHQKFVDALKPMYEKYKNEIGQDMFDLAQKYNK